MYKCNILESFAISLMQKKDQYWNVTVQSIWQKLEYYLSVHHKVLNLTWLYVFCK